MDLRIALALCVAFIGCSSEQSPIPAGEPETSVEESSVAEDTTADALADSGCPAPAIITPSELPTNYQAAERANLNYTVDGDTAHFYLTAGEKIVRFLYLDTEETSGAERTEFGAQTKAAVDGYLKAAKEIMVAPRLSKTGAVDLDPYGRTLALVFVDGELLQTRIIREGYSVYFASFGCAAAPLHNAFVHAEAEANANDRGIWAPGHPKDYRPELAKWTCRPNPFTTTYCK